jgi:hypothetical protein
MRLQAMFSTYFKSQISNLKYRLSRSSPVFSAKTRSRRCSMSHARRFQWAIQESRPVGPLQDLRGLPITQGSADFALGYRIPPRWGSKPLTRCLLNKHRVPRCLYGAGRTHLPIDSQALSPQPYPKQCFTLASISYSYPGSHTTSHCEWLGRPRSGRVCHRP